MKRFSIYAAALSLALVAGLACSGGGSAARGGKTMALPSDAPQWAARGAWVENKNMFGVGIVEGINNVPLAQDTARSRARAEISKLMDTYSASLMKDYQSTTTGGDMSASSESQRVEQAIKTFSANLLNGTEQKDMYFDGAQNRWFMLVELNYERSKIAALAAADMDAGLRAWVEKNGPRIMQSLEDDMAKFRRPRADAPPPPPPPAGPEAKTGPRPAWLDGACDRSKYLCGVGDGSERRMADDDGRAELARIFESQIKAVSTSFQSAARSLSDKTGESYSELERVSEHSMVTTDKVVPMSEILDRYIDEEGKHWSLAVIERARASAALRDQIGGLDKAVGKSMSVAKTAQSKVNKLRAIRGAAVSLAKREALNADHRVVHVRGEGIEAEYSLEDILALLGAAKASLSVGLSVAGKGAGKVRDCIEDALSAKGYELEAVVDESAGKPVRVKGQFDVLIQATLRHEERGKIGSNQVVQTDLTIKLINGKNGRTLRTIRGSQKGTRRTVQAAASTSATKLCRKKVPSMVKDIDRYFGL